jgi:serine/threonine protein kinase
VTHHNWRDNCNAVGCLILQLEDFEKVRVLGVGGTGIVYELLHKTNGQRYAMKEMEIKNKAQMQMALQEAEMLKDIMENISHPNIMHIEKVFQVGSKFYLVFPLCTGGELYEHVIRRGHFSEQDAAVIIRDLVSGLNALHEHDILHLDIKPENILFESDQNDARIKITDFGLSKVFSDIKEDKKTPPSPEELQEKLRALCESGVLNREKLRGTVGYMSPELILCGYSAKATDIFAAGVVLYILLCGRPPFQSKSNREVLERTARGLYRMDGPDWECISEDAKDLVRKMLIVDPQQRITAKEILAHPFLRVEEEESLSTLGGSSPEKAAGFAAVPKIPTNSNRSVNLNNALRLLSGHVNELRSEKFAMTFTRLVSSLEGQNKAGGQGSLLAQLVMPLGKNTTVNGAPRTMKNAEEEMMMFQNPEIKGALAATISALGDDQGRLSLEQFMYILKHFTFVNTGGAAPKLDGDGSEDGSDTPNASNGAQTPGSTTTPHKGTNPATGLALMLLCKFVDRDGDGMISPEDIFTTQALILQRSEVFLRVIFRLYCEAVWYPGRQLNFHQLQKSMSKQVPNSVGG